MAPTPPADHSKARDRRREPRIAEALPIAFSDATGDFAAHTKNLSASGVYCTIPQFIPPMTKLSLRFELSDRGRRVTIRCSGVVVRVDPVILNTEQGRYNIAVFFTDLSARDRGTIGRFVQQRLSAASSTN